MPGSDRIVGHSEEAALGCGRRFYSREVPVTSTGVRTRATSALYRRSRTTDPRAIAQDRGCGAGHTSTKNHLPQHFARLAAPLRASAPEHVRPPCYRRDGKISSALLSRARPTPSSQPSATFLYMTLAPRPTRQPTSWRRNAMYNIDTNNFTRSWLHSLKQPSTPPLCTIVHKSAQSRTIQ